MAFVLKKTTSFKWPVTVEIPSDGTYVKETFEVIFKKVPRSAFNELVEQGDFAALSGLLEGWSGLKDENGKEIAFSGESIEELCDDPCVVRGIMNSYIEAIYTGSRKN